jgi:hypothetical protein
MPLTSTQAAVLRAAVTSDASVSSFVAQANWPAIAANYNGNTTTVIWRANVTPNELLATFVGSEVIARPSTALQLQQMLLQAPVLDATNSNVRAQFSAIFPSSSASSTLANLIAVSQRVATKYENLFVTAQVSSVFGYVLSTIDVQSAMGV